MYWVCSLWLDPSVVWQGYKVYSLLLGPISTLAWGPDILSLPLGPVSTLAWVPGVLTSVGTCQYSGMGTGCSQYCWDELLLWSEYQIHSLLLRAISPSVHKGRGITESPAPTGSFNVMLTLYPLDYINFCFPRVRTLIPNNINNHTHVFVYSIKGD